jgi:phosphoheptose isomerase
MALSTSGRLSDVVEGVEAAQTMELRTIVLTSGGRGSMATFAYVLLPVDSTTTPRIQEVGSCSST